MKKEIIEIDIKFNGKGESKKGLEDITSVIKEQKEITIEFEKELMKLEAQLKATPKSALAAQTQLKNKIVGLKDAIKDQRLAIKSLNLEQSNQSGTLSTIKNSNKLNETYWKSNKSITDLSRVTQGYAYRIKGLKDMITGTYQSALSFIKGLSGIKKALLATGVGALVVALGFIVAYWKEISDFIEGTNKKLEKQISLQNDIKTQLDNRLSVLQEEQKLLELQGKSTVKNREEQKKITETSLANNDALIENIKLQLKLNKEKASEASLWEKILQYASYATGTVYNPVTATDDELKVIKETEQALTDATIKSIRLKESLIELSKPSPVEQKAIDKRKKDKEQEKKDAEDKQKVEDEKVKKEKERQDAILKIQEDAIKKNEDLNAETEEQKVQLELDRAEAELERLGATEQQKLDLKNEFAQRLSDAKKADAEKEKQVKEKELKEDKKRAEEKIKLEQNVRNAKLEIASNTLGLLAEIAGKGSAVGKALAVAQATVSGIEGVQNAFTTASKSPITTLFPAYPYIQAGLAGAFSALQIKKILSTNTNVSSGNISTSGASGGAVSVPQQVQAPSFNIVGSSGTNQLATAIGSKQNQPIRAYVVSNDVTTAQSLDRNIISSASIG